MKYFKITKHFKGGFNIHYASMPQRKQMKRKCWQYQLEEWGEAIDGGHNYGYRIAATRSKGIPKDRGKRAQRLEFNEYYLVKAAKRAATATAYTE